MKKYEKLYGVSRIFLSRPPAFFATVGALVDFEFDHQLASGSFIESIHLGKGKKSAANPLTKQTVHSYFVPFAQRR